MCEFCKKFDFSAAKVEVTKYGANILLALCNTKFDKEEQFNFCPVCGRDLRKEDGKKDNTCCGCVYENIDDTTEDISKCVCCKRNVDYAKNDYYMRKEDEGK